MFVSPAQLGGLVRKFIPRRRKSINKVVNRLREIESFLSRYPLRKVGYTKWLNSHKPELFPHVVRDQLERVRAEERAQAEQERLRRERLEAARQRTKERKLLRMKQIEEETAKILDAWEKRQQTNTQ